VFGIREWLSRTPHASSARGFPLGEARPEGRNFGIQRRDVDDSAARLTIDLGPTFREGSHTLERSGDTCGVGFLHRFRHDVVDLLADDQARADFLHGVENLAEQILDRRTFGPPASPDER
jgi:hypothetical protein